MERVCFAHPLEVCESEYVTSKQTTAKELAPIELFDDSKLLIGARFRGASGRRSSIHKRADTSERTAIEILETSADLTYENAKNSLTRPAASKLVLVDRKAHTAHDPLTGEKIKIPTKRVLKFKAAKPSKKAQLAEVK
jgi:nucleoid DNA-binding protein